MVFQRSLHARKRLLVSSMKAAMWVVVIPIIAFTSAGISAKAFVIKLLIDLRAVSYPSSFPLQLVGIVRRIAECRAPQWANSRVAPPAPARQ